MFLHKLSIKDFFVGFQVSVTFEFKLQQLEPHPPNSRSRCSRHGVSIQNPLFLVERVLNLLGDSGKGNPAPVQGHILMGLNGLGGSLVHIARWSSG